MNSIRKWFRENKWNEIWRRQCTQKSQNKRTNRKIKSIEISHAFARATHTQSPQRNRKRIRRVNKEQSEAEQQQQRQQLISNQHANFHRIPIIQLVDKRISSNIININYHLFRQTQAQQNAVNARCSIHFLQFSFSHSHCRLCCRSIVNIIVVVVVVVIFFFIFMSVCIRCVSNVYSNKPNYLLNMRRVGYIDAQTHICSSSLLLPLFVSVTPFHQESQTKILRIFFSSPPRHFHFHFHFIVYFSYSLSLYT